MSVSFINADKPQYGQFPGPYGTFTNCDGPPIKPTAEGIHLGADARKQFLEGRNPPSWVTNETAWDKAKTAALKSYNVDDDAFWPVVATIYRRMTG